MVRRIKLLSLRGKVYPDINKPQGCPMPITQATTFQFIRTPHQIQKALEKKIDFFQIDGPCWENCTIECPAKKRIEAALKHISK